MAAYTSTQSGNFSANSTWGGGGSPSANNDTFYISSGHTVTLDTAFSNLVIGFGDSSIYGTLKNSQSQNTELRMAGRLYIYGGGTLHLCDNSGAVTTKILFHGNDGETHGLFQENQADANFIAEGSDGMPSTTLSANEDENSTSLAVASGTNFAAGEWIAVFNHTTASTSAEPDEHYEDEGFLIHDVDGNTIYFRHFVGPDDVTISSVNGATVTVNNAKKHRFGQYVIFGTGGNRNVKQISSIDLVRNQITFDSAVTGSVDGEVIYLTGTQKQHDSGDKVRKVATIITSESTGTTITVANTNKFANGDSIFIADAWSGSGTIDYDDHELIHTVQSVDSTTQLTLSSAPGYTCRVGAFVTRLTRNITIGGIYSYDKPYYYNEYLNDGAYSKTTIIKDVHFKDVGSTNNQVYSGFVFRGRNNSQSSQVSTVTLTETIPERQYQPWLEGITINHNSGVQTSNRAGLWLYSSRYAVVRCSFNYRGKFGLHTYWEESQGFYNCIVARQSDSMIRIEGARGYNAIAYCYANKGKYGYRTFAGEYDSAEGSHHNIIDSMEHMGGSLRGNGNYAPDGHYAFDFRGIRYGFYETQGFWLYSRVEEVDDGSVTASGVGSIGGTSQEGHGYTYMQRGTGGMSHQTFIEFNFEIDSVAQYNFRCRRVWEEEHGRWAVRRRNSGDAHVGFDHLVYVPAGTVIIAQCALNAPTGFSYVTYPRIYISDIRFARDAGKVTTGGGVSNFAGHLNYTSYTSAMIGDNYETKSVTTPARDYSRYVKVGVYIYQDSDHKGFYMKDIEIGLSKPYESIHISAGNSPDSKYFIPEQRVNFTTVKKRLGGRIR